MSGSRDDTTGIVTVVPLPSLPASLPHRYRRPPALATGIITGIITGIVTGVTRSPDHANAMRLGRLHRDLLRNGRLPSGWTFLVTTLPSGRSLGSPASSIFAATRLSATACCARRTATRWKLS
jgi:hypothetical protein